MTDYSPHRRGAASDRLPRWVCVSPEPGSPPAAASAEVFPGAASLASWCPDNRQAAAAAAAARRMWDAAAAAEKVA
ncbi:unnamed protein product [Merluccius merluccius]